ncbi:MAG: N-acetylmuramoyl-L-alanine amidase [Gallionellaceae bacterium]|jgi:N-acetylmuramoyl-L-alanine amidase|nr:N-acetylmuramoyl-L-alanine amidase [Gallionellaceae bacterium]
MPGFAAKLIGLLLLLWLPTAFAAVTVNAVRIWPSQDYTRLTLESKQPIRHKLFALQNPERLVIDLEDVELHGALDELVAKIGDDNPQIKSVRVGQFKPGVVRMVLDLRDEAKPQLFSLAPVANYGHRLVLDVYPATPADPMMALIQLEAPENAPPSPQSPQSPPSPPFPPLQGEGEGGDGGNIKSQQAGIEQTPIPTPTLPPDQPRFGGRLLKGGESGATPLIIAIDAGHGGEDPGALGRNGTHEKTVTLAIARKLKERIDAVPGLRGVLIRDGDYFIPLGGRTEKARRMRANLFISIHADAFVKPDASGASVFALSEHGATSAAARWLAKNENEADLIGGVNIAVKDPNLARTLLDLSQTVTISDSLKLGKHVLTELGSISALHRGIVEQAGFAVLKSPDIPSILVETAFISNPTEERRLRDDAYQTKLADAILNGVQRYLEQNPPVMRQRVAGQ